jgi:exo-1,4-beta-D-glucosaminidase
MSMDEIYSETVPVEIKSDESKKVSFIERPVNAGDVYFLKLVLEDNEGKEISSNFYWLSSKGDEKADFTALNKLPEVELNFSLSSVNQENGKYSAVIEIENPSASLAFSVNPKIIKNNSKELVLPIFWEDNYFSLLPKEKRSLKVEFNAENMDGETPILAIDGWNIKHVEKGLN